MDLSSRRDQFRVLFVLAAMWNLAGGILGYFNTAYSFELLFGRALADPLYFAIYRGACGTTLIYFVGYLVVAFDPQRHAGVVLVGGIGKVGYAHQLTKFYSAGLAGANALVVIVGDLMFSLAFLAYGLWVSRAHWGRDVDARRCIERA